MSRLRQTPRERERSKEGSFEALAFIDTRAVLWEEVSPSSCRLFHATMAAPSSSLSECSPSSSMASSSTSNSSSVSFSSSLSSPPPPSRTLNHSSLSHTASSLTLEQVREASARIRSHAHRTPVLTSSTLDRLSGFSLFFKCENFQRVGAFKFRGALNTVLQLTEEEAARGVTTHSSGNHGQALALAAKIREIPAYIVMPQTAPLVKQAAVRDYGAQVVLCQPTLKDREESTERVRAETGATLIHPYDRQEIILGQGTAALELLEQTESEFGEELDAIVAPVGGGGLLSGTCVTVRGWREEKSNSGERPQMDKSRITESHTKKPHFINPHTNDTPTGCNEPHTNAPHTTDDGASPPRLPLVFGAEPSGADDAARSLAAGRLLQHASPPRSMADGLLTTVGALNWAVLSEEVEDIFTVTESEIQEAMRLVWERMKVVVEPSSAVAVAAVLKDNFRAAAAAAGVRRVGIILSGGNVDLEKLPWKK